MYFTLGFIVLIVLTLGLGFLIGFFRGMKRSLLRTIIMIVCFIIAFFCKDFVVDLIKEIKINNKTISELISSSLGEDLASLKSDITGLVDGLLKVLVYLLLALFLNLIALAIVYPICKIFVKKPPIGKKKRLFGGLIGLGMGLIICIVSFAPLAGLVSDVADVTTSILEVTEKISKDDSKAEDELSTFSLVLYSEEADSTNNSDNEIKEIFDKIGLTDFNESFVGKTFSFVGGWYYNMVSTYEVDGKKTNLHTTVGAIAGATKLAGSVVEIMTDESIEKIKSGDFTDFSSTMKELDEIKGDMTDKQIEALSDMLTKASNSLLQDLGSEQDIEIDFSNIDLKEVSFATEGKLLEKFQKYSDEDNKEPIVIGELINDLSKSTVILPLASNMDLGIELSGEQKSEVLIEISKVTDLKAKEQLEKLFGLAD